MGDFHFCISLTIKSFILYLKEQFNMTLKLDNFTPPNLDAWRIKIKEETKSEELVDYSNEIEAINIDPTDKSETKDFSNLIKSDNNDWAIGAHIEVVDEENANSYALQCLSKGVNLLYIAVNKKNIEWRRLFKGIHIEYIKIAVKLENNEQLLSLEQFLSNAKKENVSIVVDPLNIKSTETLLKTKFKIIINAFHLEQIGAKATDQLSITLHFTEKLLSNIDDPRRIQFDLGIGSDFFIETSKFRALNWLWKHLLKCNNLSNSDVVIHARSGWTNKSIIDPDTNLLRQTTESISAISGGANSLLIHAPNTFSNRNDKWFYKRLGINISHILKEEAYFTKVNDPLKGAYLIEKLTEKIITNSWNQFLSYQNEDDNFVINRLVKNIEITRELKLRDFNGGDKELIGINVFPIENDKGYCWSETPRYLGFDYLIYEKLQNE